MAFNAFVSSKHSVAGHAGTLVATGIFSKKTTSQEFEFYQNLQLEDHARADPDHYVGDLLSDWVPKFYGSLTENSLESSLDAVSSQLYKMQLSDHTLPESVKLTDKKYIVLSNLYDKFVNPSILDIKLGSVLTDESASPEKVERLKKVSESTTSSSLHFRFCGMKVLHPSSEMPDLSVFGDISDTVTVERDEDVEYLRFDKYFGRNLDGSTVKNALKIFIFHGVKDKAVGLHYLQQFWKRLQLLYNCLLNYEVRIVSGSLLFILENSDKILDGLDLEEHDPLILEDEDDSDSDDEEEENIAPPKQISSLHLIDFAHSKFVKGQGIDDNIMEGIENLITIFEQLIEEAST
ncbi:inositol polyphosphate multikinase [Yamadazyma tenuis]|uniref:Kinase n=1 Tax=Candida tenuis (strain ATCC 10573 / BCRC 21748 / CBS 615 / JCM 9827 / NBRC 10315 / NRRL Y-1498 / VKM Y-70) TaxID=590646 RepID=G3BEQ4_CANTC|nr:uncharacterized protein CANTEDRAFT_111300 [Yamadazyma tenuis ATCC 10573]EGV59949.1 hypothetical protein CANTEDRAFT_111300 [Yamadazyma tenuis ATCC 10573]WEJ94826.1 inositol polyphosphate multikinase [Yamadazyma tenuis]